MNAYGARRHVPKLPNFRIEQKTHSSNEIWQIDSTKIPNGSSANIDCVVGIRRLFHMLID